MTNVKSSELGIRNKKAPLREPEGSSEPRTAKRRVRKGLTLVRIPKSDLLNPLEIRRHWRLPMHPRIGSLTGLNHVVSIKNKKIHGLLTTDF